MARGPARGPVQGPLLHRLGACGTSVGFKKRTCPGFRINRACRECDEGISAAAGLPGHEEGLDVAPIDATVLIHVGLRDAGLPIKEE